MADVRPQRAILARDAATARLRRLTVAVLAGAAAIAGAVAGYAASITHNRSVRGALATARAATAIPPVPVPAATVPVAGVDPGIAPASSAPATSSAAPIVVSGGS
jgi:hypothetical protein